MKNFALIDETTVKTNLINLRQIVFEVTEKCNLNCTYCGLSDMYQKGNDRGNRDLPFIKAKLVIDYFVNLWKETQPADTNFRLLTSSLGHPNPKVIIKELCDEFMPCCDKHSF